MAAVWPAKCPVLDLIPSGCHPIEYADLRVATPGTLTPSDDECIHGMLLAARCALRSLRIVSRWVLISRSGKLENPFKNAASLMPDMVPLTNGGPDTALARSITSCSCWCVRRRRRHGGSTDSLGAAAPNKLLFPVILADRSRQLCAAVLDFGGVRCAEGAASSGDGDDLEPGRFSAATSA